MQEFDRREAQDGQHGDHDGAKPGWRLDQIEIKCRQVPRCREAAEIVVGSFHLPVGEIKRAGDNDDYAGGDRQGIRQLYAGGDGVGWNEHVSGEIDDEIEPLARPARQNLRCLEFARQRTVEPVDHQRHPQAEEHPGPMPAGRQDHREQCERRAAGGENMDCEGAKNIYWLPQSSLTISHERPARFQLRPKPRKRDLSARATITSGPIQYSLLRIMTLPCSFPRTGVMAPSTYFSIRTIRVSPC